MTAGRDALRSALAEALPESLGPVGLRRPAVPSLGVEPSITGYGVVLIDALLPVVERFAAEQVAAALREAAGGPGYSLMLHGVVPCRVVKAEDLRARAAAVLAAPDNRGEQ